MRPATRHLVSNQANQSTCGHCGGQILTALDDGIRVRADATFLASADEVAALLAGRHTYTLTAGRHLILRDADRIGRPLDPGHTIHADHQCHRRTQQ